MDKVILFSNLSDFEKIRSRWYEYCHLINDKTGRSLSDICKVVQQYYDTFSGLKEYKQNQFKENCPSGNVFGEYLIMSFCYRFLQTFKRTRNLIYGLVVQLVRTPAFSTMYMLKF